MIGRSAVTSVFALGFVASLLISDAGFAHAQELPISSFSVTMTALQREAILGTETSKVAEFADEPQRLFTTSGQKLMDSVWKKLHERGLPFSEVAELDEIRIRLSDTEHFTRDEFLRRFTGVTRRYMLSLAPAMRESYLLGAVTQQAIFNINVLHEEKADELYREIIGSSGVLDEVITAVQSKRRVAAAAATPKQSLVAMGELLVALQSPGRPFRSASAVVDIGVESVVLKSRGSRNNTIHMYFAFVRADGSETTLGGYRDNTYDFDDRGDLFCGVDKEPSKTGARVVRFLTPPGNVGVAEFSRQLHDACANFNGKQLPLPYAPDGNVPPFNDNAFVSSLLKNVGRPTDLNAIESQFPR